MHVPDADGKVELDVDLGQVGYRLRRSHHLRPHVASSDFPEYLPQPGTGENPWTAVKVCSNRQSLRPGACLSFAVLDNAT